MVPLDDRSAGNIHEARKLTGRQLVSWRFREVVAVYIRDEILGQPGNNSLARNEASLAGRGPVK